MTPRQEARGILDEIEGVLGGSLPFHDDPYLSETIKISLIVVDKLIDDRLNSNVLYPSYWYEVKKEIEKL